MTQQVLQVLLKIICFNPYSSGLAVMTKFTMICRIVTKSFNPYSSGLAVMTQDLHNALQEMIEFQSLF